MLSFWERLTLGALVAIAGGALAVTAERRFKAVGTNVPPWKPALHSPPPASTSACAIRCMSG